MAFTPAAKTRSRARVALLGPAGSGKTFTALRLAHALANGGRIAVIDTERGSASKYAGDANPDGGVFAFDCDDELPDFAPAQYTSRIANAVEGGYAVLVIDSLSHAWSAKGGILEFVDKATDRQGKSDKFGSGWRQATPLHNDLVDRIVTAPVHVIVTMRTKMEYIQERDANGKTTIRKVGMQPVQREGLEYEFDVILDLDESFCRVGKTRCSALRGKTFNEPGADLAKPLREWLEAGVDRPAVAGTWAAERATFEAALAGLELDLDDVTAYCSAKGAPAPSVRSPDQLRQLVAHLGSPKGRADLAAFLAATGGT